MDESLPPIAAERSQLPFFDQLDGGHLAQRIQKTICSLGQGGTEAGASGHSGNGEKRAVARKVVDLQLGELTGLGTNRQGPAPYGTGPFQKRVMGLEPTTFTLAT